MLKMMTMARMPATVFRVFLCFLLSMGRADGVFFIARCQYNILIMQGLQHKNRWRRFVYSRATIIILAILVVLMAHGVWDVYQKERLSATDSAEAAANLKILQDRQAVLSGDISKLSTPEGTEEEIRSKYSVAKPGENMVIMTNPGATSTASTPTTTESWWQKIISAF
jgi:cell division protein FtsB